MWSTEKRSVIYYNYQCVHDLTLRMSQYYRSILKARRWFSGRSLNSYFDSREVLKMSESSTRNNKTVIKRRVSLGILILIEVGRLIASWGLNRRCFMKEFYLFGKVESNIWWYNWRRKHKLLICWKHKKNMRLLKSSSIVKFCQRIFQSVYG